jgi:hypothetical protein
LTIEVLNSASWLIPKSIAKVEGCCGCGCNCRCGLYVLDSGVGLTLEMSRFEVCGTSALLPLGVAFDRELLFGTFRLEFDNFSIDSSEVPGPSDFELSAPTEVRFLASVFAVLLLDVDPFSFTLELERDSEGPELEFP